MIEINVYYCSNLDNCPYFNIVFFLRNLNNFGIILLTILAKFIHIRLKLYNRDYSKNIFQNREQLVYTTLKQISVERDFLTILIFGNF